MMRGPGRGALRQPAPPGVAPGRGDLFPAPAAPAIDPALGKTVALRLERQIGRARLVLDKATLIARYFDDLAASTG